MLTVESTWSLWLKGFGVFLDIKNMEYKNVDDSKQGGETETVREQRASLLELSVGT